MAEEKKICEETKDKLWERNKIRAERGRKEFILQFAKYKDFVIGEAALFTGVVMLLSASGTGNSSNEKDVSKNADSTETHFQQSLAMFSTLMTLLVVFSLQVFRSVESNRAEMIARATLLGTQILTFWQMLIMSNAEKALS